MNEVNPKATRLISMIHDLVFQGNGAQMLRVFPYGALQFSCYEFLKLQLPRAPVIGSR